MGKIWLFVVWSTEDNVFILCVCRAQAKALVIEYTITSNLCKMKQPFEAAFRHITYCQAGGNKHGCYVKVARAKREREPHADKEICLRQKNLLGEATQPFQFQKHNLLSIDLFLTTVHGRLDSIIVDEKYA